MYKSDGAVEWVPGCVLKNRRRRIETAHDHTFSLQHEAEALSDGTQGYF